MIFEYEPGIEVPITKIDAPVLSDNRFVWQLYEIDISNTRLQYFNVTSRMGRLIFRAVTGEWFTSDIALDDISVSKIECTNKDGEKLLFYITNAYTL